MSRILLKLTAEGDPIQVDLESSLSQNRDAYRFRCRGAQGELTVERVGPCEGWLLLNGEIVPYYAIPRNHHLKVWVRGRIYTFEVVDSAARRSAEDPARKGRRSDRLSAPMPGSVRKIHVRLGESFEAHQPLVIMESMKMELTLSVPHSGRVAELTCHEGQLVEMGATLVRLAATAE